jgi:hypothetical protein
MGILVNLVSQSQEVPPGIEECGLVGYSATERLSGPVQGGLTFIIHPVTARTEFDSRTGGPEMDIDWTFGDYSSLYAKERGLS